LAPNGQRLGSALVFPADRTEPRIALVQDFLLGERGQTVGEIETVLHPGLTQRRVALRLGGAFKIALKKKKNRLNLSR
jgi:hypothetical protein